jgi:hypothetical protein
MVPNTRVVEVLDSKLVEGGRERQDGAADMRLSRTKIISIVGRWADPMC